MSRRDDHRRSSWRWRSGVARIRARMHFRRENPAPMSFEEQQRANEIADIAMAAEMLERREARRRAEDVTDSEAR